MKILFISLNNTINDLLPRVSSAGHTYKLFTELSHPGLYQPTDKARNRVLQDITDFAPDMIINMITALSIPTSDDYIYLGNTTASAKLETHKWEARNKAKELGWRLPEVLEECTLDSMSSYSRDTYLKPKGLDSFHQSWKVPADTDMTNHNAFFPPNIPAYVEENLDYEIGVFCEFIISNGAYSIRSISAGTGNGEQKMITSTTQNWVTFFTQGTLTSTQESAFRSKCEAWLDYAVTLGGNYEGSIDGALDSDNNVYWFEQNCRPSTHSTFAGDAQKWLDGIKDTPSKAAELTVTY